MNITQDGEKELRVYYKENQDPVSPCQSSNKTCWLKFTPYDCKETFNYALKMLILPGAIAALLIWLFVIEMYDYLFYQILGSVFTTIATFLIFIYSRERFMEWRHRIRNFEQLSPRKYSDFNDIKEPKLSIGFVGDIMMMRDHVLEFHKDVKDFFKGVPLIVGNLEGTMPKQNNFLAKQSHPKGILKQLESLLIHNNKLLLCVSNNHSIDFGNDILFESIETIRIDKNEETGAEETRENFYAFGRNDVPKVFIDDDYCISTASKWSNQKKWKCITKFDDPELDIYYCKDRFNMLYPHWGYENERYTRRCIQKEATELLKGKSEETDEDKKKKWDLIFGHHPHTRQPVIAVKDKLKKQDGTPLTDDEGKPIVIKKLVAFSGGNFTSGVKWLRKKKHIHGIIMKCKIGRLKKKPDQFAVGEVEWTNTLNDKDGNKKTVTLGVGTPERQRWLYLIIAIGSIILIFLPRILELFG